MSKNGSALETAPLLADEQAPSDYDDRYQSQYRQRVLILVCISIVAADFGSYMAYAPQIAVFESLICRQHNGGEALGSLARNTTSPCKTPGVQGELALINGWKDTVDQVPGIALALPYGFLADRVGRKPVLLLSLAGLLLEEIAVRVIAWSYVVIPLRTVWAVPIFQLLGGGPQVANSMAYAMVSDLYPADKRASVFFLMAAAILLGEILATPISAFLMSWNPWIPYMAALLVQLIGFLATTALSETRSTKSEDINSQDDESINGSASSDSGSSSSCDSLENATWKTTVKRIWLKFRSQNPVSLNMGCILGAFLLASIGRQALQLIIQYASKRFSWSIARASSLITLKGIINLVVLLVLLPRISLLLSKCMSAATKDLLIVQVSISILALGTTFMALAAHPALFIAGVCGLALGWGFYSALRSLAMAQAAPAHIGVVNTAIGFAQSIGIMVAGPVLAAAFRRGIDLDGLWLGLPYMVAAVLFVGAGILVMFGVRIRKTHEYKEVDEDLGSERENETGSVECP